MLYILFRLDHDTVHSGRQKNLLTPLGQRKVNFVKVGKESRKVGKTKKLFKGHRIRIGKLTQLYLEDGVCVLLRSDNIHLQECMQRCHNKQRCGPSKPRETSDINPLKPELNPICYLLALLGAYHFFHVSRIRVKLLTFRLLMSYIYGAPILDVSRSHTTTQHSR